MNDRYLYRAKRTDNGEWVEGNLVFDDVDNQYRIAVQREYSTGTFYGTQAPRVKRGTICQCTGRNDEWEHDVFQYDDERYEIQFCEDSLTWEAVSVFSSESIGLGEFSPSEYVRLGNSIDNPELLEVGCGQELDWSDEK